MFTIPRPYLARLQQREQLTATVFRFVFAANEPLIYQPGQYASWLIGPHRRPMSFASPADGAKAEFLVDTAPGGIASQFSLSLKPGSVLNFLAPYGQFIVDGSNPLPRLLLATGTGIAPIRAQLLADHSATATTLVFGTRWPQQRFLDHELLSLAKKRANLTYLPVCLTAHPEWTGAVGHAAEVAVSNMLHPPRYQAYICGSPAFVNEAVNLLLAHGLPAPHIHTEQYTMSLAVVH